MKKLQIFALLCLSTVFVFTACQKENLLTDAAIDVDQEASIDLASPDYVIIPQRPTPPTPPLKTIIKKESSCLTGGLNLKVYQLFANDVEVPLNTNKYDVEWFTEDFVQLGESVSAKCLTTGTYLAIVSDKVTVETSASFFSVKLGPNLKAEFKTSSAKQ